MQSVSSLLTVNAFHFGNHTNRNSSSEQPSSSSSESSSDKDHDATLIEQQQLQSLKIRDREVRAHELAHVSVGGQYTSGASFTYEKGSDGVLYAVAGEVSIDTSEVAGNPVETLEKAQIIQRAALAPAEPSAQDRAVATSAMAMAQKARADIAKLEAIEKYVDTPEGVKSASLNVLA